MSIREPVRFFSNPQEWRPGARLLTTAAATWTDGGSRFPASVPEIIVSRSGVRVAMQDLGQDYTRVLDTCWHELLHPTLPFTHPQEGLPPEYVVDYPKLLAKINGIKREFPRFVLD